MLAKLLFPIVYPVVMKYSQMFVNACCLLDSPFCRAVCACKIIEATVFERKDLVFSRVWVTAMLFAEDFHGLLDTISVLASEPYRVKDPPVWIIRAWAR